ncbi:MAG: hypothetical protein ABIG64_09460 [Candidatus Omnitrophota bacterium]
MKKIIFKTTILMLIQILFLAQNTLAGDDFVEKSALSPQLQIQSDLLSNPYFSPGHAKLLTSLSNRISRKNKKFFDREKIESLLLKVEYHNSENIRQAKTIDDIRPEGMKNFERDIYIQNNRSGECSGNCDRCYKHNAGRRMIKQKLDPMSVEEIEQIIQEAFSFNITGISLNGEDSFDDWESLLAVAQAYMKVKNTISLPKDSALRIISNGFAIIADLNNAEDRFKELHRTGVDFELDLSWDADKVKLLKKRHGWTKDQVITKMAKMVIIFRDIFPDNKLAIRTSCRRSELKANDLFRKKLREKFRDLSGDKYYRSWQNDEYPYPEREEFNPNKKVIKKAWREEFNSLTLESKIGFVQCFCNGFIDMAASTMSNCWVYSNNFNRKISAKNFKKSFISSFLHPLFRHLYLGSYAERATGKLRELFFACSFYPEYWEMNLTFEQFETKIINDAALRTKIGLLSLLRDILLSYNEEEHLISPISNIKNIPNALIPQLVSKEILTAYLRYLDELGFEGIKDDEYGDNHAFFKLYQIWRNYRNGKIENKEELKNIVLHFLEDFESLEFLPFLNKIANSQGIYISLNLDSDKLKSFFDQLTEESIRDIFRNILLEDVFPEFVDQEAVDKTYSVVKRMNIINRGRQFIEMAI